jgi:hypothetical protein
MACRGTALLYFSWFVYVVLIGMTDPSPSHSSVCDAGGCGGVQTSQTSFVILIPLFLLTLQMSNKTQPPTNWQITPHSKVFLEKPAGQETAGILLNTKINHRVHKNSPLIRIPSHINPLHNLISSPIYSASQGLNVGTADGPTRLYS